MYSPGGHKELDTTEQLNTDRNYLIQSFVQKPLQMSESPGLLVFPRQVGMETSPFPSKGAAGHICLDIGPHCLHLKVTGPEGGDCAGWSFSPGSLRISGDAQNKPPRELPAVMLSNLRSCRLL